jgi:hypothetical protein
MDTRGIGQVEPHISVLNPMEVPSIARNMSLLIDGSTCFTSRTSQYQFVVQLQSRLGTAMQADPGSPGCSPGLRVVVGGFRKGQALGQERHCSIFDISLRGYQ